MSKTQENPTNTMAAGLRTGTRAPQEALKALAQLSGESPAADPDFNPTPVKPPPAARPLVAERALSFQVTMNPRELRKQLGVRVLQSIQMRLKKAAVTGQLSGEGPQTAQEIVEAALVEYLDKLGH